MQTKAWPNTIQLRHDVIQNSTNICTDIITFILSFASPKTGEELHPYISIDESHGFIATHSDYASIQRLGATLSDFFGIYFLENSVHEQQSMNDSNVKSLSRAIQRYKPLLNRQIVDLIHEYTSTKRICYDLSPKAVCQDPSSRRMNQGIQVFVAHQTIYLLDTKHQVVLGGLPMNDPHTFQFVPTLQPFQGLQYQKDFFRGAHFFPCSWYEVNAKKTVQLKEREQQMRMLGANRTENPISLDPIFEILTKADRTEFIYRSFQLERIVYRSISDLYRQETDQVIMLDSFENLGLLGHHDDLKTCLVGVHRNNYKKWIPTSTSINNVKTIKCAMTERKTQTQTTMPLRRSASHPYYEIEPGRYVQIMPDGIVESGSRLGFMKMANTEITNTENDSNKEQTQEEHHKIILFGPPDESRILGVNGFVTNLVENGTSECLTDKIRSPVELFFVRR